MKELGGLPLALTQAGAFMHQTNLSVEEYLRFYREMWSKLFEETSKLLLQQDDSRSAAVTTWELSYRQVELNDPNAAKLLQVCSCLSSWDIWYGLFSSLLAGEMEQMSSIPDWFRFCIHGELNFERAIKTLLDYSMLEPQNDPSAYFIQPVVHEWCFNFRLGGNLSSTVRLATMIVASAIKDIHDPLYRTLSRRLYPHCERISRLSSEVFKCNPGDEPRGQRLIDSWFYLADFLHEYGKFAGAEIYNIALYMCNDVGDKRNPNAMTIYNNMGLLYMDEGRIKAAERMLIQAQGMCEQ